jgi:hypothetical protein
LYCFLTVSEFRRASTFGDSMLRSDRPTAGGALIARQKPNFARRRLPTRAPVPVVEHRLLDA